MQSEFIFEGKKYISGSRASKISGYTTDYIGQLSRKKILDSRMSGGRWFVSEESLKKHQTAASVAPRGRFDSDKYLSVSRASQISGYNPDYIGQLCRRRILECRMAGGRWFVSEESLKKHIAAASVAPRGRILLPNGLDNTKFENYRSELAFQSAHHLPEDFFNHNEYKHGRYFFQKIAVGLFAILLAIVFIPRFAGSSNGNLHPITDAVASSLAQVVTSVNVYSSETTQTVVYSGGLFTAIGEYMDQEVNHAILASYHGLAFVNDFLFNTSRKVRTLVLNSSTGFTQVDQTKNQMGITVVPSSGNQAVDDQVKKYVTDSFSDETEVIPDKTGNSGILKPVFKDKKDQQYLYVIVPVKDGAKDVKN